MRVDPDKKLRGLNISLKVGSVLEINGGELKIQVYETHQNSARLTISADRTKYKINRTDKPRRDQCHSPEPENT